MSDSKPNFIFFRMLGCFHCEQFAKSPSENESPWAQLLRDKEINAAVKLIMIEWGMTKKSDGTLESRPLSQSYKFITWGPAFYIHESGKAENGTVFPKEQPRSFADLKKFILDNSKKLTKNSPPQAAPTPAAAPISAERKPTPNVFNAKQFQKLDEKVKRNAPVANRSAPIVPPPQTKVQSSRATVPQKPQDNMRQRPTPRQPVQASAQTAPAMSVQSNRAKAARAPMTSPPKGAQSQSAVASRRVETPNPIPMSAVSEASAVAPSNAEKFVTRSEPKGKVIPKTETSTLQRKFIARNHRNQ